jgi:DNA-binding PadR family transcriptional regulator
MKLLACISEKPKHFVEVSNETTANHSTVSKFLSKALKYRLIEEQIYSENDRYRKVYAITELGKMFLLDFRRYQVLFSG